MNSVSSLHTAQTRIYIYILLSHICDTCDTIHTPSKTRCSSRGDPSNVINIVCKLWAQSTYSYHTVNWLVEAADIFTLARSPFHNRDTFTHILNGCITCTRTIAWLLQCQWSNLERYGQNRLTPNYNKTRHSMNRAHIPRYVLQVPVCISTAQWRKRIVTSSFVTLSLVVSAAIHVIFWSIGACYGHRVYICIICTPIIGEFAL